MIYAYIKDPDLISFLIKKLKLHKYKYPDNFGLSYPDIIEIINKLKEKYKYKDMELAKRQLEMLKGELAEVKNSDLFLAYFNAILFGSEASRNNLSYVTGLMTLELITKSSFTYEQAFQSPNYKDIEKDNSVNYAIYPMTSPFTGAKNFLGYLALMETTYIEERSGKIRSDVGMKLQREYPQWAQIPLKESLLIHYWLRKSELFSHPDASSETVLISCAVQRSIAKLLNKYFDIPLLSPIPKSDYEKLTSLGIHSIVHRLSNSKPISHDRLGELKNQYMSNNNELNMIYVTPADEYALASSYYKMEKLHHDYQYEREE